MQRRQMFAEIEKRNVKKSKTNGFEFWILEKWSFFGLSSQKSRMLSRDCYIRIMVKSKHTLILFRFLLKKKSENKKERKKNSIRVSNFQWILHKDGTWNIENGTWYRHHISRSSHTQNSTIMNLSKQPKTQMKNK